MVGQMNELFAGPVAGVGSDKDQLGSPAAERLLCSKVARGQFPGPLAEPQHGMERRRNQTPVTIPIPASSCARTSSEMGCSRDRSRRFALMAFARHSLSRQR